ncbi:SPOR domain-containing protein [Aquimarina litoralis]|uniref:HU domain-containing protein n=1 Tax=Aquimarina litoralis TaxID=584605 RepID=UPI001C574202|nr:SPOR domain-containing protein [Aquimarina litoralis]MBW1293956.1 SPOR domain-containing protein [Aquimarina litoralis]
MNNTAKYISELLYRYECVILPGFGAFLTKRQPAMIQESTHAFFPPQKLISFNSQLQNNDGLLANYIATAENISYTDAVAKIQRYVLWLQNKMSAGNRLELEGIGAFYTSVENTLQFEPYQNTNYLSEAFGLNSFISPSILREKEIKTVLPEVATSTVTRETYKEQVEAIEETAPIAFTPEKRRQRPYLKYAAVLGFGVILGSLALYQVNTQTNLENDRITINAEREIENRIQEATFEITSPLPAINLNIIKSEENTVVENSETEETTVTNSSAKYHIVAGAFRIKANAAKKVNKLKAKGFEARLIGINKYGLHQVVYNSFENRLEALTALQNIKKQQDRRAWLLVQEL